MPLTLEERERVAYIEGRTQEATDLGAAVDAVDDRIDEAEQDAERLREDLRSAEAESHRLRDDVEAAETKLEAANAKLAQVRECVTDA